MFEVERVIFPILIERDNVFSTTGSKKEGIIFINIMVLVILYLLFYVY